MKVLPFPQRIDLPRVLKAPLRNTCITWALEGDPENVNKILNMITLTETAVSSAHFYITKDRCCLFELNIATPTPVFFFFNFDFLL